MQAEAVVEMGRGPVTVHGHGGSLTGWFRRGGFLGNDRKPVGPVEFAHGTAARSQRWRAMSTQMTIDTFEKGDRR